MGELSLKFILTENTGTINIDWLLLRMPFGLSSVLTLMVCMMFLFNMGKYNALQFISMDAFI
jgi:hypothetical protein